MIASLLLTSMLASIPAAVDDGGVEGWYRLKFEGIRSLPSVPLRHANGLPELVLVHEPAQTRVYGLNSGGVLTSVGQVDVNGRVIGTWRFFRGSELRWVVEVRQIDSRVTSTMCPRVRFEVGRDEGPLFAFTCLSASGKPDGIEEVLDVRGAVRLSGMNAAGSRTGPWLTFAKNGEPSSFARYVDGELDGEFQLLNPEGSGFQLHGEYRAGKAIGTWSYVCVDGVKRERVFATPTKIVIDHWQHECDTKLRAE